MGGPGSGRTRENPLCVECGGNTVFQYEYISDGSPGSHIQVYKCTTTGCRETVMLDVLEGVVF